MRHLAAALCLLSAPAFAQSNPSFITGQIPTAAQWNSYFGKKADVAGGTINNGVLNSVTINGSLGGSPTVGGVWTASNATLSGFTINSGTFSGITSLTGTHVPSVQTIPLSNNEPALSSIFLQTQSTAVLCTGVPNCDHGGDGGGYYHNYLVALDFDHTQPTMFGVGLYVGALGESGAGPVWAANFIAHYSLGFASTGHVIELDSGNAAFNAGSTPGSAGLSSGTQLWNLVLSGNGGAGWFPVSSMLTVTCSQTTGCANRGITVASGIDTVAGAGFEEVSHAYQAMYVGGSHTYAFDTTAATLSGAALRVQDGQVAVASAPNGGGADYNLMSLNGSNVLRLGASSNAVVFNDLAGGDYLQITAGAAASGKVGFSIPSAAADTDAGYAFTPKGAGGFSFGTGTTSAVGGTECSVFGLNDVCTGSETFAAGSGITMTGGRTAALGQDINDRGRARGLYLSPGQMAGQGDNQTNIFMFHARSSSATPIKLASDNIVGTTSVVDCGNLVSNSTMTFRSFRLTYVDTTNQVSTFWTFPDFQVLNNAGTLSFVSGLAPTPTQGADNGSGVVWVAPTIALDQTAKCAFITATAPNADISNWYADMIVSEVRGQ